MVKQLILSRKNVANQLYSDILNVEVVMKATFRQLSEIMMGIGIEIEEREMFIDFSDLDYTDADVLLIKKNTIKRLLKNFITDCYEPVNISEKELLDNVTDVFENVTEEYIDITA